MVRALTLLGVAAATAVAQGTSVEICSDSLNDMGIKDVELPEFVFAGEEFNVKVTSEPNKYIGKGHIRVEFDVEGIKVASATYNLCSVGKCHVDALELTTAAFAFQLPKDVPAGFSTTVKITVNDHNGAQLSCVEATGVKVQSNSRDLRVSSGSMSLSVPELEFLFEQWSQEHGLTFSPSELMSRMTSFADNLEQVAKHNADPAHSYSLGLNQFAHLSLHEFTKTHFGYKGGENSATVNKTFYSMDIGTLGLTDDLPDEIDWTKKGAVTPVKNQGSCGSCWAFSTTGALEGAYFLKTGKLVSFSEQELVSCDKVDQGCNGGLMDNADRFIQKAGGLCTEADYPYVSGRGGHARCKTCNGIEGSAPTAINDVAHTEQSLEAAVAGRPVSVAIEADQLSFQFYRKGVLTGSCGAALDHGVLVVGYGTLDGTKYWKVKNSWGPAWGLSGYLLMQRGKAVRGGECGVLLSASYPTL